VIGRTLLHYAITEKLGEGGMGVVYKATDTHLDRFVALKVLPPERVSNEERKRRFVQEAKAASALNHPNIVHIYDIATDQDTTFIAMEYVPGKTLAESIPRQGLPVATVLTYAIQIADGLAQAHKAGIIHRDLKSGNVIVSDDRRVRILDFGLAKLVDASTSLEDTVTRTSGHGATPDTDAGMVLGTAAYMSPEQAEGRPVDTRTDIFSFGVILYEMLTGRRPFGGDTALATLSAILKDSPTPLADAAPGTPADLARVVERCLRKDPARRWQHMDDVRIALLDLKEESDSGRLSAPAAAAISAPRLRSRVWASAVAATAVMAVGVLGWSAMRRSGSESAAAPRQPIPLTSYEGDERDPTFSPDGNQIAFSWGPEGGVTNTYVKLIGPGEPIRLTNNSATERESQWSPDGRWICFDRRPPGGSVIIVVPALGGPERNLGSTDARCHWSPDSQYVLVPDGGSLWLAPVSGGQRRLLIGPTEIGGAARGVDTGAISPDGRTLAVNFRVGSKVPLYFVTLDADYTVKGTPRRAIPVDWNFVSSSWTADSQSIIGVRDLNGANLGGDTAVYRIHVSGGEPERVDFVGDNPWFLDVSKAGNRLAFTRLRRDVNLYRARLGADDTLLGDGEPVARSSRRDYNAAISPDGSRIAFSSTRSGADEIWVADRDGNNLVQLTTSANPDGTDQPAWSPDGSRIAYVSRPEGTEARDVFVIPVTGGSPVRITDDSDVDTNPTWSADGKWIYFVSQGTRNGVWKAPATGGAATQVSSVGGGGAFRSVMESPDGKSLLHSSGQGVSHISLSGGEPQVLTHDPVAASVMTSRGLYYLTRSTDLQSATIRLLPLDGSTPRTVGVIPHPTSTGLSVAPDFSSIIYSRCDQCAADLMLVEGFK
jgi:serine/threonine protein kinase/Tol biopolymer transport system component